MYYFDIDKAISLWPCEVQNDKISSNMEISLILIFIAIIIAATQIKRSPKKVANSDIPPKLNEEKVDVDDVELSDEQKVVFNKIENTSENIFVTGKAGTGKSHLLQYLKKHTKKKLVVCAPTGVAALNVGGQTINSLFRIPPGFIPKNSLKVNYKVATLLRNIDTVVIDEISMVRADMMDAIDHLLRQARNNSMPFGGVQLVMFGDLYQLPPVVEKGLADYFDHNHGGPYFFNAHVWKDTPIQIVELQTIHRQKDEDFKKILNAIRIGITDEDILTNLNYRTNVMIPEQGVITLATTNQIVNEINYGKLSQLPDQVQEYKASIYGNLEETSFPTEEILRLKKGAQVMLLKNDKLKRWVNGTIGIVESLTDNEVKVKFENGIIHSIPPETWNKIRYTYDPYERKVKEEVLSSFTQFPLRLAWAITVHKSQGQTYGAVAIDMGDGAFVHGQTYVALSRCTSLEGLFLKRGIERADIMVDPTITEFMKKAKILTTEM